MHDGLIDRLQQWAQTRPQAPALRNAHAQWTYGTLVPLVRERAAWLHASGVRPGDTVALAFAQGQSLVEQVELLLACIWLGAPVLPLYPELHAVQQQALLGPCNARWLLSYERFGNTPWLSPAHYARALWEDAPAPRGDTPQRGFYFEFTSGTTGAPKAVCPSASEYAGMRLRAQQAYGWHCDDVALAAQAWPSKVGIRSLLRTLWMGACLLDRPFPHSRQELLALIQTDGLSYVDCSPWQLRQLLASPGPAPVPLRLMTVIGAAISPDEIRAGRQLVPNLHVGYGSTELGLMGHLGPADAADAPLHPFEGMQTQALDAQGRPLPAGALGRLRFRAAWTPQRYALGTNDPVEGFHAGWFVSSDLGRVLADGRIALAGRADDAINVGGAKVLPLDVEQALLSHPDVADVAVLGVPEPLRGEAVAAFLVLRQPLAVDALRAYLATRLQQVQLPVVYVGLQQIPRNPEGKVLAQPLRDFYAARKREADARATG